LLFIVERYLQLSERWLNIFRSPFCAAPRGVVCTEDHRLSASGATHEACADSTAAVWSCDAGDRRL